MTTALHPRTHLLLTMLLLAGATTASAAPWRTPGGLCYPLDGLRTEADLASRLMSGGCWLAGLPGYPAYKRGHVHAGVDLRAELGETICAIAPGIVDPESDTPHSGYGPGWTAGRVLIVRSTLPDGTPYLAVYGHTQDHLVQGGQRVKAGQPLAGVGPWLEAEGGPHLHLTIRLGELPRWGWGTPTLAPGPAREGAELVACAADVEGCGYRNPLEFLRGRCAPAGSVVAGTADPAASAGAAPRAHIDTAEEFTAAATAYWRSRPGAAAPRAAADEFSHTSKPLPYGGVWCQTYRCGDRKGALLAAVGGRALCWVPDPVWTIYNLQGGPAALGAPLAEARDWPEAHAQGFARALLVIEKKTDRVRVIWRR